MTTAQTLAKNTNDGGKALEQAIQDVRKHFPDVVTVSFDEDACWQFADSEGNAPNFEGTDIDTWLLEDAAHTVTTVPATFCFG
jgi:hypothetical protein